MAVAYINKLRLPTSMTYINKLRLPTSMTVELGIDYGNGNRHFHLNGFIRQNIK